MSEPTFSLERDLREAEAMAEGLVPYVYENELYGRLGMNQPRLTIGGLLMRLRRLEGLRGQLNDKQRDTVNHIRAQYEAARKEWGQHSVQKMTQEAESRLRDLNTYFKECQEDPKLCANAYLPEAARRTMIHELLEGLPESDRPALMPKVRQADSGLRRYVRPSDFVWAAALKPVYPADVFWWLYNRP